jgi:hypothetical protein
MTSDQSLSEGFYQAQRDRLQEENQQLRDRIKYLEGLIRLGKRRAEQTVAELTL